MQINELWDYLLSFTIYGTDEYMHYKIIATLFLIGGVYIFLIGCRKSFLLRGGKLIKYHRDSRKYPEESGLITILLGLSSMGFAIFPLLYVMFPFALFRVLHEVVFKRK